MATTPSTFYASFADMMADQLLQWTQGFQVGSDRILPPTPDQFAANLTQEAVAFGIAFPGSSAAASVIQQTIDAFKAWYGIILLKQLPMNTPQAYQDWYSSTHPVTL
jgi:hypothetical protein